MPDLLPGEGFNSVSTLESIDLQNSKIAHVQYASQGNQLSFLDGTTNSLQQQQPNHRPFVPVHNAEYGHLSLLEGNAFRGHYIPQRPSQYSALPFHERNVFSSFDSSSPVSLTSSDSAASSASSSPPNSVNFHHELSELGVSLSKLALHAEGAPIIVSEDGGHNVRKHINAPFFNGHNGGNNSRQHSRRRSYRLLHTLPPPGSGPFLFPEVDPFTCFSSTSLSTAYQRYQQNVAYFYQNYPSLYSQASISPQEAASQQQTTQLTNGQLLLHHHHFHHVHYHHHLHSKQQLKDWPETGLEEIAGLIGKSAFQSAQDDCQCDDFTGGGRPTPLSSAPLANTFSQALSNHEQTVQRANLLKGDDLVFQQAVSLYSNEASSAGRHFRPIGSEAAEARKSSALLLPSSHSPLEPASARFLKGQLHHLNQPFFAVDLIDETSSLDSSLEDAPYSLYSSLSSSSCSSSSSEPNIVLTRDLYCDVRPDVIHLNGRSSRAISAPAKSSPMCSLTLSPLDESSSSLSMPSSPSSSFTSNSPLLFASSQQLCDSTPSQSLLSSPSIVVDSSAPHCLDNNSSSMKLPRPIKSRKRRKKDKPIAVFRRISAASGGASYPFDVVAGDHTLTTNHFCQDSSLRELKCSTAKRNYICLLVA